MSVSSTIVAKGLVPSNHSGNLAAQRTSHIHQFGYSPEDPVNKRMQNPSYHVGTLLFTRNPDVERIIAAVESLTPSTADSPSIPKASMCRVSEHTSGLLGRKCSHL